MDDLDHVLPLPPGDPERLDSLAATLTLAGARGSETVLARHGAGGLSLAGVWTGPAAEAALAEAQAAARLCHEVGERFVPAAAALRQYAGELAEAHRSVEVLREQWRSADRLHAAAVHQPMPLGDPSAAAEQVRAASEHQQRTQAELATRHTACVRQLEASQQRATTIVTGALGEAVSPAGQRLLMLASLPVTEGAALRARAQAVVDQALAAAGSDPTSWTLAEIQGVLGSLAGVVEDPRVAQALMERLGAKGLEHAVATLWQSTGEPRPGLLPGETAAATASLGALAGAFVTSVSDTPPVDAGSAALLGEWRSGWTASLLNQPMAGLAAQLALVAAAAARPVPLVPGDAYATAALRSVLARPAPVPAFDAQRWRLPGYLAVPYRALPDPATSLFGALQADPALARRVMLAPGHQGATLVHDLTVQRPLAASLTTGSPGSSAALGSLLLHLADDGTSAEQAQLRHTFLDALGEAGQRWWQLDTHESVNVAHHLDPLRWPAAVLLASEPDLVWESVNETAVADDGGVAAARMQALVGEIARDLPDLPDGAVAPRGLSYLLHALALSEGERLAHIVQTAASPTGPEVAAAGVRLGQVVGFTGKSAVHANVHAGAALDAVNAGERAVTHDVVDLLDRLIPAAKAHPVAAVVSGAIRPAVSELALEAFDNANRVDHAATASREQEPLLHKSMRLVSLTAVESVRAGSGASAADVTVVAAHAADQVAVGAGLVNPDGPEPTAAP